MLDFNLASDIFSTDFTSYKSDIKNATKVVDDLNKYELNPKYFSSPIFIMWEITGRCPNNCIYCYNSSPKKVNELSHKEAMKLAEELVEIKPFSVCLTGGEPTIRDDYFEIANYLRSHHIPISTVTSGFLVDEQMAKRMTNTFDYIQVSLDGHTAGIHDKIRGVDGSYARAVNAINLLKKNDVKRLSIATSLCKYNKNYVKEIMDFCQQIGGDEWRTQYLVMVGKAGNNMDIELSCTEYENVKNIIAKKQLSLKDGGSNFKVFWGDPSVHIKIGKSMSRVTLLRITSEGYFSISPYLPFVMGNAKINTILEIWRKGMRRGWENNGIKEAVKDINDVDGIKELGEKFKGYVDVLL